MYYTILILIVVALISIIYVWYITRYSHIINDSEPLELQGEENKILDVWYQAINKSPFDFGLDNREIAANFIERLLNRKVDPEDIVIGNNLKEQYYKITGKNIEEDYINVRDLIGKPWEFLIITDKSLRDKFIVEQINLNELNDIMLANLDKSAYDYIADLLSVRWGMINELNDSDIINDKGSYLYVKLPDNIEEENKVIVKQNIVAARTMKGARINLLCDNWEFETLIKRLKQSITVVSF